MQGNSIRNKKIIGGRCLIVILFAFLSLISCAQPEPSETIRIHVVTSIFETTTFSSNPEQCGGLSDYDAKTISAADGLTGYRLTVADDSGIILDSGVQAAAEFIITDIMPGTYEVTAYGYASDGTDEAIVAMSHESIALEKGGEYSIVLDDPIEGKTGEIRIEAILPYNGVYTHDRDTLTIKYIDGQNEAITLSTADGTLIYEGDENGVWHYSVAAGIVSSGNAIMMLSVISDDGNTAERTAMAVLLPELRHIADEWDFDFREGKEKLPQPILRAELISIDTGSMPYETAYIFLDNYTEYPEMSRLFYRYIKTDVTAPEFSSSFAWEYAGDRFYDIGGDFGGIIEAYISCAGYGDSDIAKLEISKKLPTPIAYISVDERLGEYYIDILNGEEYPSDSIIHYVHNGNWITGPSYFMSHLPVQFGLTETTMYISCEGYTDSDKVTISQMYPIQTTEPMPNGYSQPEFPDPSTGDYGPIPGSGLYREWETVTLSAPERMNNSRFLRWDENQVPVSTNAEYSFICTGPRQLVPVYAEMSGGGGGSSNTRYSIIISTNISEAVNCPQERAERGETVTFYISDQYPIESLEVIDINSEALEITREGDGSYTFVMPAGEVTIKVIFSETEVTVPMALPDGSVLFYDRGEEYGSYHIGDDGYLVRDDGAVDDGTVASTNWRYLICDKSDLGGLEHFDTMFSMTDGTEAMQGTGLSNTDVMITRLGNNNTLLWRLVKEKRVSTGFNWFVPSKDELDLVYENRFTINDYAGETFHDANYWSSSESSSSSVYVKSFSGGEWSIFVKFATANCRLIRRI